MPAFTSIALAIGAAAAVGGLGLSAYAMTRQQQAGQQQAGYQAEAIALQKKADEQRRQAMELDAARRRREAIRSQISSRATAETVATNQGAEFGSGLPGAYGGISGRTGVNTLGINQNAELGGRMFDINGQISDAYRGAALAGGSASMWQGLSSLGGSILANSQTIGQVGSFFTPRTA